MITCEALNWHHGQLDCVLRIKQCEELVGHLNYSEFEGTPKIQMINVYDGHQRRGYATQLVMALQSHYPDKEIDWGCMTDEGSCLHDALPVRMDPTPEARDFARLKRLRLRLDKMEAELATLRKTSQCQHALLTAYYCLEGRVSDLSESLWNKRASKRILVNPDPSQHDLESQAA